MSANRPGKKGTRAAIWWVAGAAVLIVGGLVGLSTFGGKKAPQPQPDTAAAQSVPTQTATVGALKSDKDRGATRGLIGRADAPFKLIEYSDFL